MFDGNAVAQEGSQGTFGSSWGLEVCLQFEEEGLVWIGDMVRVRVR